MILRALEKDPALRYQTAAGLRADLLRLERAASAEVVTSLRASATTSATLPSNGNFAPGRWRGLLFGLIAAAVVALVGVGYLTTRGERPVAMKAAAEAPPGAAAVTALDHSIAVLPFADMSPGKDQEYFSDGISEELLNLLAKIPQLQVTARTSSFAFKGKEIGIPDIARQLHVSHVLEGSVRKAGDQVRITAQLIDAATDSHLWSQTYDRKLDDIFAIQDEIAADVVLQLQLTLLGTTPKVRETDPGAYALFLRAGALGRQSTAEAFQQSDALLHQVLAVDPRYAPAWDRLASNFLNEAGHGLLSNKEGTERAREAAMKALEIDPKYAPAHATLGWIAMFGDIDLASAARHFGRALALDPSDLTVLGGSAVLLVSLGRLDAALALYEVIVRRDPVDVTSLVNLAATQRFAGLPDEAIASYRAAMSLSPGLGGARTNLGMALLQKGDAEDALVEVEQESIDPLKEIGLAMATHALGRKSESDAALAALIEKYESDWAYNIAYVYAFRGEADQAFTWLDKAVATGDPGLSYLGLEPLFDSLHGDARWLPLLRRLGKAPEQLSRIELAVALPQ